MVWWLLFGCRGDSQFDDAVSFAVEEILDEVFTSWKASAEPSPFVLTVNKLIALYRHLGITGDSFSFASEVDDAMEAHETHWKLMLSYTRDGSVAWSGAMEASERLVREVVNQLSSEGLRSILTATIGLVSMEPLQGFANLAIVNGNLDRIYRFSLLRLEPAQAWALQPLYHFARASMKLYRDMLRYLRRAIRVTVNGLDLSDYDSVEMAKSALLADALAVATAVAFGCSQELLGPSNALRMDVENYWNKMVQRKQMFGFTKVIY